jgi:sugar phosphate isomerase/epimerase
VELAWPRKTRLAAIRFAGEPAPAFGTAGDVSLLRLEPFESALLTQTAAGRRADQPDIPRKTLRDPLTVSLAGTWTMRPCSPNVLPLFHWLLHVTEPDRAADGGGPVEADPIVTPAPLANQLRQGRFRWAPRILTGFGQPARIELAPLQLRYTAAFGCAATVSGREGLRLVIEPGSITGSWHLWVNGAGPFTEADMVAADAHTPGCLGLPLDGLVRPGTNEVSLTVDVTGLDQGRRNAVYVAGDIGVEVTRLPSGQCRGLLVPPARRGRLGDWTGSRLPFYAGVVEYEASISGFPEVLRARRQGGRGHRAAVEPTGEPVHLDAVLPSRCAEAIEIAFEPGHPRYLDALAAMTGIETTEEAAMRFAYSTLACPGRRLEETLELGARTGYEGVELRLIDGELIDPGMSAPDRRRVADACARAGMPVVAVDSSIRVAAHEDPRDISAQISAFLDLAAEWGAPTVRVFGGELPDAPAARRDRLAAAASVLQRASDRAERLRVRIGVETHDAFLASATVAELLALVPSPWVGAVWDSHHPCRAGESAGQVYAAIGSRLCLVQAKDAARTGAGPGDWRLVPLGEGEVPVREMLRLLIQGGYDGWVSVEWEKRWHPEIDEPEKALPQHLGLLQTWVAELTAAAGEQERS